MWTLITAFIVGIATAAHKLPEKFAYPAQRIPVQGIRDIRITGVKGTLKMHGRETAGSKFIKLKVQHSRHRRYEDWHLSVERRGQTLFLEVFNTAYGKQWKRHVREELWPEFDIELTGHALPTTVAWREGRLEFKHWNADLEVSFLKGGATVIGGQGELLLQPVTAAVSVSDHAGPLTIKGDSGQVHLERNRGGLNLSWVTGQVEVVDCNGKLEIESRSSELQVRGGGGQLNAQVGEGSARISAFRGAVNGKSERAKWELSADAPSDVNITTQSGPVGVNWKTGGAKVFLTSAQGTISHAGDGFLRQTDHDGRRVVEGTKSSKSMGQVFVRTESGAIHWRQ